MTESVTQKLGDLRIAGPITEVEAFLEWLEQQHCHIWGFDEVRAVRGTKAVEISIDLRFLPTVENKPSSNCQCLFEPDDGMPRGDTSRMTPQEYMDHRAAQKAWPWRCRKCGELWDKDTSCWTLDRDGNPYRTVIRGPI